VGLYGRSNASSVSDVDKGIELTLFHLLLFVLKLRSLISWAVVMEYSVLLNALQRVGGECLRSGKPTRLTQNLVDDLVMQRILCCRRHDCQFSAVRGNVAEEVVGARLNAGRVGSYYVGPQCNTRAGLPVLACSFT
jgi:hypothetical protein